MFSSLHPYKNFIDNAVDLDMAIPIYNFLEYCEKYENILRTKYMVMLLFETLNDLNKKE